MGNRRRGPRAGVAWRWRWCCGVALMLGAAPAESDERKAPWPRVGAAQSVNLCYNTPIDRAARRATPPRVAARWRNWAWRQWSYPMSANALDGCRLFRMCRLRCIPERSLGCWAPTAPARRHHPHDAGHLFARFGQRGPSLAALGPRTRSAAWVPARGSRLYKDQTLDQSALLGHPKGLSERRPSAADPWLSGWTSPTPHQKVEALSRCMQQKAQRSPPRAHDPGSWSLTALLRAGPR